ncbi:MULTISPECIES: cyclase family protein [Dickeya]|uniref:Kynurenine formamidase, bacterial n=1 Tax=Dickeya aquatica TaxID=1401087 RepID=A0A375A9M2_9GAMM|nr:MULTISPECIES: cyclase family protein [Dickeya]SLM62740.1 Kynurenine formamidase, bacterial [Dickeya aquatica]
MSKFLPKEIIDLSIPFSVDMPKYDAPWFPKFSYDEIKPEQMSEANWHRRFTTLNLFAHNGTHIESGDHAFRNGYTVDKIELKHFVGYPVIIDLSGIANGTEITPQMIEPYVRDVKFTKQSIILIRTGYDDNYWDTDNFWDHSPWLNAAAADLLVSTGAGFFGLDFQTEKPGEKNFVVHKTLLSGHAVLCEYLFNLDKANENTLFMALPISVTNTEACPVRAVLIKG